MSRSEAKNKLKKSVNHNNIVTNWVQQDQYKVMGLMFLNKFFEFINLFVFGTDSIGEEIKH